MAETLRQLVRGTIRFQRLVNAPMLMSRTCILAGPYEASRGGQLCAVGELDSWEIARNLLKLQGRFCPRLGKNYS